MPPTFYSKEGIVRGIKLGKGYSFEKGKSTKKIIGGSES
jgi:hypothetical protein